MNFWEGKRVLITGHTGFKGSWMTKSLLLLRSNVYGYSLPPVSEPSIYDNSSSLKGIKQTIGDIRDLKKLTACFQEFEPEIVFHLAAQPLVQESFVDPVETFEVNVMGTVNLLEACRHSKSVKSVVIITSDKCYENNEWVWGYRENDHLGGKDPYSASKGCAEIVSSSYRRSFFYENGGRVATARAGNVFGGGDWSKNRLIPDIVRSLIEKKSPALRNPNSVRPWQFVLEPIAGYLLLGEKNFMGPGFDTAWNFGPDENSIKSVGDITKSFLKAWGAREELVISGSEGFGKEANLLCLDSSKARVGLNWRPKLSLDEGLNWTSNWYKEFCANPEKTDSLLDKQILNFFDLRVG